MLYAWFYPGGRLGFVSCCRSITNIWLHLTNKTTWFVLGIANTLLMVWVKNFTTQHLLQLPFWKKAVNANFSHVQDYDSNVAKL